MQIFLIMRSSQDELPDVGNFYCQCPTNAQLSATIATISTNFHKQLVTIQPFYIVKYLILNNMQNDLYLSLHENHKDGM
jgi:hypothetical protein